MIPYGRQQISEADIEAVVDVLRGDLITQGSRVPQFENAVAELCHARHAVAVSSGTAALHIACLALGLGDGDQFWTVPNTFVATANAARHCGAQVDFVDIDPITWNLSIPALDAKLARAEKQGCLPKIVAPVHFAGQPCDLPALHDRARKYGFKILEDAAHALGATWGNDPIGSCRYSDITIFSFHPVKVITTGEGGMALTNDDALFETMTLLRSHGVTRDPRLWQHEPAGSWHHEQQLLGFNYRLTDIQAALGQSQLQRLGEFITKRSTLAARYDKLLADLPLQRPAIQPSASSAWHLYVIRILPEAAVDHSIVFQTLRDSGFGVQLHYFPVHLQPYYREQGFECGDYPEAECHGHTALSLPLHQSLSEDQQDQIVGKLRELLS
jgi:UDP-4-amino-4,6-dideoxy-N-acetyl-beta-L-altrosamine transaminase